MILTKSRKHFLLCLRALLPTRPIAAELGVLYGDFAALILEVFDPKRLLLIDPYVVEEEKKYGEEMDFMPVVYSTEDDYLKLRKRFQDEIDTSQVLVVRKHSHDAVDYVADKSLDFIYHDASHLYGDLQKDLEMWLPKLKDNGLMCGHDYVELGNFGVIQAVDEFVRDNNFEFVAINDNGGDWALKKSK